MSNLSHQFDGAIEAYEDMQRRRYARKKGVSGFVGNGYWFTGYPYMVGAMGSGTLTQTQPDQDNDNVSEHTGETANTGSGMGEGGTAASASGAAGGSPA
jgi:hypothetical protein